MSVPTCARLMDANYAEFVKREAAEARAEALQQERDAERRWCKHWAERAEAAEAALATTRQALEPVRVFMEHFVPVEEALINGFDVDAWCELADRALADTGGDSKEPA